MWFVMEDMKRLHKFHAKPGDDFHLWRADREISIWAKGVFNVVKNDVIRTVTGDLAAELQQKVDDACEVIIGGLGDKPLKTCIMKKRDPYSMWKIFS